MDIELLVKLTTRRWSLPILSALHRGVPGRQAVLLKSTGASRAGFLDSLAHLQALGLVLRNSGHGHPLRPEYVISPKGRLWADRAAGVLSAVSEDWEFKILQRAWALPVLVVAQEAQYFGGLKNRLSPVTDRALSQVLKGLNDANWLRREIDSASHPPRPRYQSIHKGAQIAQLFLA